MKQIYIAILKKFSFKHCVLLFISSFLMQFSFAQTPPGNAQSFNGTNQYDHVAVPFNTINGNSVSYFYTVEAWVLPQSTTTTMEIFSTRGASDHSFDMKIVNGNTLHADIGDGTNWITTTADVSYTFTAGKWYHIAYTVGFQSNYTIYINGNQVASAALGGNPPVLFDTQHLDGYIGSNAGSSEFFKGEIDEVRVYRTTLQQSSIQADMTSTALHNTNTNFLYYNFDVSNGTTLTDNSTDAGTGASFNGTLVNGPSYVQSYAMGVVTANAATSTTDGKGLTASCTAPTNVTATNYLVDVAYDAAFTVPAVTGQSVASNTSFTVTGLNAGITYYYRISPNNTAAAVAGQGTYSNTVSFTTNGYPNITSFSPSSAGYKGTVNITGTNLGSVYAVTLGGVQSAASINSSTSITVTVGAGASGVIAATSPVGTGASLTNFTFIQPTVTGFSPSLVGNGTTITITGTGLQDATGVTVGGTAATNIVANSQTSITAKVGAGTTGVVKVIAQGGTATSAASATFVPAPTVTSVSPSSAGTNDVVNITGTNFYAPATVTIGGAAASSVNVSGTTLITCLVPSGVAATGVISVTTPYGTGSSGAIFTYILPTVTSFAPTGAGIGNTITISGTFLNTATAVTIGGATAQIVSKSAGTITAIVPANAASGNVVVTTSYNTVTTPGFTFLPAPGNALFFSNSNPVSINMGSKAVTGSYTIEAWMVPYGNEGTAFSARGPTNGASSDYTVDFKFNNNGYAFDIGNGTSWLVNGSGSFNFNGRQWYHIAMVVSPTGYTIYIEGTAVQTGTFPGGSVPVLFDGINHTSFSLGRGVSGDLGYYGGLDEIRVYSAALTQANIQADRKSTAISVPASLVSYYNCDVSSTGTLYDIKNGYNGTFDNSVNIITSYAMALPIATAATSVAAQSFVANWTAPAIGGAVQSYLVEEYTDTTYNSQASQYHQQTVTGTSATFNGLSPNSTYYYRVTPKSSSITVLGSIVNGGVSNNIAVTTAVLPSVNNISPGTGPAGTQVTISGSNFTSPSSVTINGTACTAVTVVNSTTITATVATGTSTGQVVVTTAAGSTTDNVGFSYVPPVIISSISPSSGTAYTTVTISGSGFNSGVNNLAGVTFGGSKAESFSLSSDNLITAVVPGGTTGPVNVVTQYLTASSPTNFTFTGATPPGNAIQFLVQFGNGGNVGLNIPNGATLSGSYTVEAWVMPAAANSTMPILTTGPGNQGYVFDLRLSGGNTIHADFGDGNTILATANAAFNYSVGQWYHIACAVSSSGYAIYANDSLVGVGNFSGNPTPVLYNNGNDYLEIGADLSGHYFAGNMDEFRIWNTARTQAQIEADMLNVISNPISNASLKLYYNFDQINSTDYGQNIFDLSASNFNVISGGSFENTNQVASYAMVTPAINAATGITGTAFTANWNAPQVGSFNNYVLDVAADSAFTQFVTGYNALAVASNVTSLNITGLNQGVKYYYRLKAVNTSFSGQAATTTGSVTTVQYAPAIYTFSPANAIAGKVDTIKGSNFSHISSVAFGGIPVTTYTLVDSNTIYATVPVGAASGNVTVTTTGGTAVKGSFTYGNPPGNALAFDGVDDYAVVPASLLNNLTTGTFETWVYLNTNVEATILMKQSENVGTEAALTVGYYVSTTSTPVGGVPGTIYYRSQNTGGTLLTSNTILQAGHWYHIALAFTATSASLYVNGHLDVTVTGGNFVVPNVPVSGNPIYPTIGAWIFAGSPQHRLNGRLDELRVWNVTRTQTQIDSALFNTAYPTSTGLAAYYNFDAVSGTTLYDISANGNNATLTNFALSGTTSNWVQSYAMVVPTATAATAVNGVQFTANWTAPVIDNSVKYLLDVATDNAFVNTLAGYNALSVTGTSAPVTGLSQSTTYYYRVRADTTSISPNQGGYSDTISVTTLAVPPATITSFTPGISGQDSTVIITGTNFTTATTVKFGNTNAKSFVVNSSTQITAVVNGGATGFVSITTQGGTATSTQTFTWVGAPTISSFTPTAGGFNSAVAITGTNFYSPATVTFAGSQALSVVVNSATSITAMAGTGATGKIQVNTPGGSVTSSGTYTWYPLPTIISFTPSSGGAGVQDTITGTNFTGATAISFGGIAAASFTVVNATTVYATPASIGATGVISVSTPGGTATSSAIFTWNPSPTITSISASQGYPGSTVTITGTNFTGASAVSFGGTAAASFTVNSATSITATVGTGASGNVTVTAAGGTASYAGFTWYAIPAITSFNPGSAGLGSNVTITGSGFVNGATVTFGGTPATAVVFNSSTSLTATVGAGTTGNITVTTPGGTAISTQTFNWFAAPAITSFTPTSSGFALYDTITGTNLAGATAVSFNGQGALTFNVVNNTTIIARVGGGTNFITGNVQVTTPGGTAALGGFTWVSSPTITSFSPTNNVAGTVISITGTNFTPLSTVSFQQNSFSTPVPATSVSYISPTNITATVPAGLPAITNGYVVVNAAGGTTSGSGFNYIPPPTITNFSPLSAAASNTVTITGTNLSTTSAVSFGGTPASSFTVVSNTVVTAIVAGGSPSGNVSVTTQAGTFTAPGFDFISYTGHSLSFNGSNYVSVPVGSTSVAGNFTVEAWVMQTNYNTNNFFSTRSAGGDMTFDIKLSAANIGLDIGNGTNWMVTQQFGMNSTYLNQWIHIACAVSPTGYTVYINGIPAISGTLSSAPLLFNSTHNVITIGSMNGSGEFFNGNIDEVKIWSTTRSQAQITGDMDSLITSPAATPGLAAYYNFDEGTAGGNNAGITSLVDGSANNLTGTLNNFALTGTASNWVGSFAMMIPVTDSAVNVMANSFTARWTPTSYGPVSNYTFYLYYQDSVHPIYSLLPFYNVVVANYNGVAVADSFLTVTGLKPGTRYFYFVQPNNLSLPGTGPYSQHLSATTQGIRYFTPIAATIADTVTIIGAELTGTTAVSFGGTPAASFTVINDTTIKAVLASGSSGYVDVTVSGQTDSLPGFRYVLSPVITSFNPASTGLLDTVIIKGSALATASAVSFGGIPAASFSVTSDTSITAIVKNGASGNVSVTTAGGTINKSGFTYTTAALPPPGNALSFNGNNSYVTIPNKNDLKIANNFTIEAWVKPNNIQGMDILSVTGGNPNVSMGISNGYYFYFAIGNSSYYANYTPYIAGRWMHLAVTISPAGYTMYINGVNAGSGSVSGSNSLALLDSTVNNLYIGAYVQPLYSEFVGDVNGSIDELKLWNTTRTHAQIQTDMAGVVNSPTADPTLAAYYNFDEGTPAGSNSNVNQLFDLSSYNNTGALTNFALTGTTGNWVSSYAMEKPVIQPATNIQANSFTANWNAPALGTAAHYIVEVSNYGAFYNLVTTQIVSGTSATITGLSPLSQYWYRVTAYNDSTTGLSPYSDTISVTTIIKSTITHFTPSSAGTGGTVTITGNNIDRVTGVSFGGVPASAFTINNASSISAIVGAGSSGYVSITSPGGVDSFAGFTYVAIPVITSFTPASAGLFDTVKIHGQYFTSASSVSFGGVAAASFTVTSDTAITAIVGSGASGQVSVTTPGGTGTNSGFTYNTYINPTILTPPGNALNFDGSTTYIKVPVGKHAVGGDFTVEAWVLPSTTGNSLNILSTRYSGGATFDMKISGGNQVHGDIGSGGGWLNTNANASFNFTTGKWYHVTFVVASSANTYTIYVNGAVAGTGTLNGGTALLFDSTNNKIITIGGDVANNEYFNGNIDEIRVWAAARTQAQVQADMLNVVTNTTDPTLAAYYNFDEGTAAGNNAGITQLLDQSSSQLTGKLYNFALTGSTSNWVESYAMVVPTASAATGVTDTTFIANWAAPALGMVTNYLLDVATDVQFNNIITGYNGLTVAAGNTSKTVSGLLPATQYYYRVRADKTSVTGQGANSNSISANTAGISSFNPSTGAAGIVVTIKGIGLTSATAVSFGGVPAVSFAVVDSATITATVGAGASGNVSVTLSGGTNALPGFTYIGPDSIFSFSPATAGIFQTVTIKGSGFTTASAVSFGGTLAASFNILSDTSIQAVIANGASGSVSVTTVAGTTSKSGFTYANVPLAPPGNAINFYYSSLYANTGSLNVVNNFTAEAWIMPVDTVNTLGIMTAGANGAFQFEIAGGNSITADIGDGNNYLATSSFPFHYTAGKWYHVACAVSASGYTIYVNGNPVGSGSFSGSPLLINNNNNNLYVGADYNGGFSGNIDEVRLWNTTRTQAQIDTDMVRVVNNPASDPTLVAYYNFDEGIPGGDNTAVTSLFDQSANNLTFTNLNYNLGLTGNVNNFVHSYAMVVPIADSATGINGARFTANWTAPVNDTVANYLLDVATDSAFTQFVNNFNARPVSGYSQVVTGLTPGVNYYYRVSAFKNASAGTGASSSTIQTVTPIVGTPPVITSFTPSTGAAGGTTVVIRGTNFTGALAVSFGGDSATSYTVVSDSVIDAVVSNDGATGSVSVTGPGGIGSLAGFIFNYLPPYNALNFDGVDDNIVINNPLSTDYTIEYWMRTTQTNGGGSEWYQGNGIVDGDRPGSDFDLGTSLLGTKLAFGTGNPSNYGDVTITSNSDVNTGKWVFVAATRNAATGLMKLYINGVAEDSTVAGNDPLRTNSTLTIGGANTGGNNFQGSIDELRLFTTDRSAFIKADMADTISHTATGLVSYYNFDQGVPGGNNTGIDILFDQTANGNNGVLNNFALSGGISNWVESYAMVVPKATAASNVTATAFTANWAAPIVGVVDNYLLDVATDSVFSNILSGYNALSVSGTAQVVSGLTLGNTYYYRVRANKASVDEQGGYSDFDTVTTAVSNLTATISGNASVCKNATAPLVIFTGYGSTAPYTFTYTVNGGTNQTVTTAGTDSTVTVSVPTATPGNFTYTLLNVTDSAGKQQSQNSGVTVTVKQPTSSITHDTICSTSLPFHWNGTDYNAAGTYSYTTTNAAGCDSVATLILQVVTNTMSATYSSLHPQVCYGSIASSSVGVKNGIAPYLYSLDGSTTYQDSAKFRVPAGSHSVTVKDAAGCTVTTNSITITQPAQPLGLNLTGSASCSGGAVTASATGSYGNYLYSLNNISYQAGNVLSVASPGTYTVYVKDQQGCKNNRSITVKPLSATLIAPQTAACYGAREVIQVTANYGKAPYQYSLDGVNYQGSANFNVQAGTYTVTVKDTAGCTAVSNSVTITQPAAPLSMNLAANVNCSSGGGTITVNASGGYGNYKYSINGINYHVSNVFTVASAGTYTMNVKDQNGCVNNKNVTVSPLSATLTAAHTAACYGAREVVQVTARYGNAPYSYSLDGVNYQSSANFNVQAGTYSVTVKDTAGCTVTTNSVTIIQPSSLLRMTITPTNVSCNGGSDGSMTVSPTGGYASLYSYSLNGGSYQAPDVFSGLQAGTFMVTVKDSNGCIVNKTTTITQPVTPCTTGGSSIKTELMGGLKVKVYPNPSANDFNLVLESGDSKKVVEIRVVDMFGKTVYHTTGSIFDMYRFGNTFAAGIYIAEVLNGTNVQTIKLVKSKPAL